MPTAQRKRLALAAGAALALVLFVVMRRRSSSDLVAAGPAPERTIDPGGPVESNLEPAVQELASFTELLAQRYQELAARSDELQLSFGQQLSDVRADLASPGYDLVQTPWGDLLVLGAGGPLVVSDPGRSAPATTNEPTGQQPAGPAGFWWNIGGEQTFVTQANRSRFVGALRSRGVNVDVWAARHPAAARTIGINPPPSPPPSPRPQPGQRTVSFAPAAPPVAAPAPAAAPEPRRTSGSQFFKAL